MRFSLVAFDSFSGIIQWHLLCPRRLWKETTLSSSTAVFLCLTLMVVNFFVSFLFRFLFCQVSENNLANTSKSNIPRMTTMTMQTWLHKAVLCRTRPMQLAFPSRLATFRDKFRTFEVTILPYFVTMDEFAKKKTKTKKHTATNLRQEDTKVIQHTTGFMNIGRGRVCIRCICLICRLSMQLQSEYWLRMWTDQMISSSWCVISMETSATIQLSTHGSQSRTIFTHCHMRLKGSTQSTFHERQTSIDISCLPEMKCFHSWTHTQSAKWTRIPCLLTVQTRTNWNVCLQTSLCRAGSDS